MNEIRVFIPCFIMDQSDNKMIITIKKRIRATLELEDNFDRILFSESRTSEKSKKAAIALLGSDYIFIPHIKSTVSEEHLSLLSELIILSSMFGIKMISDEDLISEDLVTICTDILFNFETFKDYKLDQNDYDRMHTYVYSERDHRYMFRMIARYSDMERKNKEEESKKNDKKNPMFTDDWLYDFYIRKAAKRKDPTATITELAYGNMFPQYLHCCEGSVLSTQPKSSCEINKCCCEYSDWPNNCPCKSL